MSSSALRQLWGHSDTIAMRISKRRLEWLGHVARMTDDRIPKRLLFGGCYKIDHQVVLEKSGEMSLKLISKT